jgi:hypothetical protein
LVHRRRHSCRCGRASLALLEDLRGLPGVTHAALASAIPLGGQGAIFYSAEGMGGVDATNRPRAYLHRVSLGYVETIGLRLIDGRAFALIWRERDQRDGDRRWRPLLAGKRDGRRIKAAI